MACSRSATAATSSAGTYKNSASWSMKRRISQGQATRSTLAFFRVTHFTARASFRIDSNRRQQRRHVIHTLTGGQLGLDSPGPGSVEAGAGGAQAGCPWRKAGLPVIGAGAAGRKYSGGVSHTQPYALDMIALSQLVARCPISASGDDAPLCRGGALVPALGVDTHDEQPQHQRHLAQETEDLEGSLQALGQGRHEKHEPSETCSGHEHSEDAGQEPR